MLQSQRVAAASSAVAAAMFPLIMPGQMPGAPATQATPAAAEHHEHAQEAGLREEDTDVDTEVDPEEELHAPKKRRCLMRPEKRRWTRRQAPEEVQMPQAPQTLPPPSCPLLALLAQDPEPWKRQEREEPIRQADGAGALDAEVRRSLARDEAVEAEELDAKILEALNEAAEAELDDALNRAHAAVSHKGLPIVFEFLEEERLFELALV